MRTLILSFTLLFIVGIAAMLFGTKHAMKNVSQDRFDTFIRENECSPVKLDALTRETVYACANGMMIVR